VEVACQLRQTDADEFRVSFRSRGRVDVSALAQRFGGGGHHNAAGCKIQAPPESIIEELTTTVDAMLGTT
jgi:phosphoesterase RecJ-like protein